MIKRKLISSIAAAVAVAALSFGSGNAISAIVCNTAPPPISVPQNFAGIYINFVTGVAGTASSAGDDFNPWANGTNLAFAWRNISLGVASGDSYSVLAAGVSVGVASTFSDFADTANFQAGTTGKYLGVAFTNEATAALNYGWVQLDTTAPSGFPATINGYCYQNDGTAINTGDTGVVVTNFTVTPSVGTPSGTISPSTVQTVASGATSTFTLTPDSGFHADTVTGTCGGTLTGNSYVTAAVTADCTVIANFAADSGGTNGIINSGLLNHVVQPTVAGTSLNIVTSAFDDTGPVSGDWDFNFWKNTNFTFYTITTHATAYVVNGSGQVIVMQNGDVVGPTSTFSTDASVTAAPEWVAGTTGVAGVRFNCDERLTFPVAGTVCYGYVRITTTGSTGFPATIVETSFDGDGNPITVVGGTPANPPSATVTPTSLTFTAAANATATQTLTVANAASSDPLTYSIDARGTSTRPVLRPHTSASAVSKTKAGASANAAPKLAALQARHLGLTAGGRQLGRNASPWAPSGSVQFVLDDGAYEDNIGWGDTDAGTENSAVWVNRFSATGALTIDSVSIMWPQDASGTLVGKSVNIVAYYDADGDGDPTNAVRLGTDNLQTIASLDVFVPYTTTFSVPGAGDVYIGFFNTYANGTSTPLLHPAAIDTNSSANESWIGASNSGDGNLDFGANDAVGTIDDLSSGSLTGNWMIRATGTSGGTGGACTGPVVTWLTATPPSGSVNGGASATVTVKADPAAGSLAAGTYTGELCITTNDTTQALISVPVTLTVTTAAFTPCSAGADEIFCDGFDGAPTGGNIVSGTINQPWVQDAGDGSSFDFALADFHAYNGSITTDDINLYYLQSGGSDGGAPGMYVYWYGDSVPPEDAALVGGVVDAGGTNFAVLQSGATIGPASILSAASISMANWIGGADGYIGVAFYNEATSAVNYGYIHVTTTAPEGYPSQALEWAYDSSGAAITIP